MAGGAVGGYTLPLGMKGKGNATDSIFPWKKYSKPKAKKRKKKAKKS